MIQRVFTLTFNTSKNDCVADCHNAAALLQHEKCLLMISSGVGCISEVMEDVMLLYGDFTLCRWEDGHTKQNIIHH